MQVSSQSFCADCGTGWLQHTVLWLAGVQAAGTLCLGACQRGGGVCTCSRMRHGWGLHDSSRGATAPAAVQAGAQRAGSQPQGGQKLTRMLLYVAVAAGQGSFRDGGDGTDYYIKVPVGTIIRRKGAEVRQGSSWFGWELTGLPPGCWGSEPQTHSV